MASYEDKFVNSKPIITAWEAYTPTFDNHSGTEIKFYYRRVGDSIEVRGTYVPQSPAAAVYGLYLPSGLTFSLDNPSGGLSTIIGTIVMGTTTDNDFVIQGYNGADTIRVGIRNSGAFSPFSTLNANAVVGGANLVSVDFKAKITQWQNQGVSP